MSQAIRYSKRVPAVKLEFRKEQGATALRSAPVFSSEGLTAQVVTVNSPVGFDYEWMGKQHYLAFHDIQLCDGETFSDESRITRQLDLRGKLTFVPSGCKIWGWSQPTSRQHSFTALFIDPRLLDEPFAERLTSLPLRPEVYFSQSGLGSTLQKLQLALQTQESLDALYLESLGLLSVVELARHQVGRQRNASVRAGALAPSAERRVIEYIDAHLDATIALAHLAALAGLSRFHFLRSFKKSTGDTPHQYVQKRRIERAKSLLRGGGMPVSRVAEAVGFRSTSRFISTFRRMNGATPGEFSVGQADQEAEG